MNQFSRFYQVVQNAKRDKIKFVVPTCLDPSLKHPCVPWKHLQDQDPSDAEQDDWIKRFANRNGAYILGRNIGRFVVDCDNLDDALPWVFDQGPMPPTQVVYTRRGVHLHFRYPRKGEIRNSAGLLHPGVDVRGHAGIAVAVGSVHASGFVYQWAQGYSPRDVRLADAPAWLLERLQQHDRRGNGNGIVIEPKPFSGVISPWAMAVLTRELEVLAVAPEGCRNNLLARIAFKLGQLVSGGELPLDETRDALYEVAASWSKSGTFLVERSKATIDGCLVAGKDHPRCAP